MQCKMSRFVEVFVAVPQQYMGIVIGSGGRNIKEIRQDTRTRIKSCNGDNIGRGSGFLVTGSASGCEEAQLAIRRRIDEISVRIKELVPQEFVRLLTKKNGIDNFREIEEQCGVKITWPKFNDSEKHVIIDLKGSRSNCDQAREMLRANLKKWQDNSISRKSVSPLGSGSGAYSKVVDVPKKYIGMVAGIGRKNIDNIETKSGTKIILPPRRAQVGETVPIKIIGTSGNIDAAEARISHSIIMYKETMMRKELGGDKHFVCFAYEDENERFCFKPGGSAPKLDGFIQGERFRIETESDDECDDESDVSEKTISEIKKHLLTPLQNLQKLKGEKPLMADLWCHFGKVLVSRVDPEEAQNIMRPVDIDRRLMKTMSGAKSKNKDAYWKVSFEEGVNPLHLHDDELPKSGDKSDRFFGLELLHTQWRYDFGFITPSDRNVRLKVWEGLPPGRNEPPVEVKNILIPVFIQNDESIKAWICYPSTSCLRGEIMTPKSQYDCRMKLRAGYRHAIDKDNVICMEEDTILSDYLSNCKLNKENHSMELPDPKCHEMPKGFKYTFNRESKERFFSATVDEESYTIIVLDEEGWDSDTSKKRDQKQFGIRVVMNSWSEALLSSERQWTPEEILDKLNNYMKFLSLFKDHFLTVD